jgi:hypothetical protein
VLPEAERMHRPALKALKALKAIPVAALVGVVLLTACGRGEVDTDPSTTYRKFTATSYANEGATVHLIADTRASRLAGPGEFLPLLVALENKTSDMWGVGREGFVLELPDRTSMPLSTYDEFDAEYSRARSDLRIGEPFIDTLNHTFANPPYDWLPLDFFPIKGAGTFPRDEVQIRAGQLTLGYLYFRLPADAPTEGMFKLLFRPRGPDQTFVLNFEPYKPAKPGKSSKP